MLQGKITPTLALTGSIVRSMIEPDLTTKNITENGTYNASSDNADGYSQVTVNVQGGGSMSVDYSNYSGSFDTNSRDYETLKSLVLNEGVYIINCCIYGENQSRKYLKITTDATDTSNANSSMSYGASSTVEYSLNCTRLLKITTPTTVYIKFKGLQVATKGFYYNLEVIKFS